jgi:tripartite-type tricarboxylate transporter receptor subunit TctC
VRALQKVPFSIVIAAGCGVLAAMATAQAQQKYPTKPVRIVVPFSAGSTPDTLARMIGPKLSESWRQPVVIENRTGAGGTIGAGLVAKATPDGYTLLLATPAFAIAAAMHPNLPYDPIKGFAGITNIGFSNTTLVVSPTLGVKSVHELIALAQAQPGKILLGSAGAGSATHINGERFRLAAGIKVTHVGFKGQPEVLIEIMAGRIHYGVGALTISLPLIKDGRLLALAAAQRTPLLPGVPSMAEVLPGWGRDGWQTLYAPAGTPRTILNQVSQEVARILALPEIRERLQAVAFHIASSTPEETDRLLRVDIETFSRVVREAGLRPM